MESGDYCAPCDWEFNILEYFETHLSICEVSSCEDCDKTFNLLKDIQVHTEPKYSKQHFFAYIDEYNSK